MRSVLCLVSCMISVYGCGVVSGDAEGDGSGTGTDVRISVSALTAANVGNLGVLH